MRLINYLLLIPFFLLLACEGTSSEPTDNPTDSTTTQNTTSTAEETPPAAEEGTALEELIPEDFTKMKEKKGDLNKDGIEDVLLVLKMPNEQDEKFDMDNPAPRPFMILLGQEAGGYELAVRNDKAILCVQCGGMMGDPFSDVVVKTGVFTLEHAGGSSDRWARYSTFKYDEGEKDWLWAKDGTEAYSTHDIDDVATRFLEVDKRSISAFDINEQQ